MVLLNNTEIIRQVETELDTIRESLKNELIYEPFFCDFVYRFCWNSNSIEGNTLSLDETIGVIDYDEVRSGHTYAEYTEAKLLYKAIKEMLKFEKQGITENWIKQTNGIIMGNEGVYRNKNLYVGTLTEAVYYPPSFEKVPELMKRFTEEFHDGYESAEKMIDAVSREHISFERIHPFHDGNVPLRYQQQIAA